MVLKVTKFREDRLNHFRDICQNPQEGHFAPPPPPPSPNSVKFKNLISFISDKAYLKLDFDYKNPTEENEIMCQFKRRYFLNHTV